MNITPALLRDWNACWLDSEIAEHFGDNAELTPRQVAGDAIITAGYLIAAAIYQLDATIRRRE